ncbi:phage head morphogenesis protein [Metapseudomonas otitidis]|uniref:phage head morphogenesis protein n=1 Tax=Metapseudomonas otitidis TaxID=319939 RepID=UPI00209A6A6A|nr:phage minor head protein [Pseudomonas otitidis]MCO7557361.1 phage minor head protein [Pseudomonas otitidis]
MSATVETPGPVPREALDYLRAKGYQVGFDYRDVWQEEHAIAWTVARAMRLDILEAIRAAVDEAIQEGLPFREFQGGLQPLLERLGWWGRSTMQDPLTGEERDVQLGSPRRLRTIYDVNLRTAQAAGQWERIQRTRLTHPYLIYQLGPSREHRPEHRGWSGMVLRSDDPWWQSHYPPNGWGCKCHVRQASRREAQRLTAGGAATAAPDLGTVEYVNRRTGEVANVPRGIDPGWDYNPGAVSRLARAQQLLEQKEAAAKDNR